MSAWNSIAKRIPPIVKAHPEDYTIYYRPYKDDDTLAQLLIIPNTTQNTKGDDVDATSTSFNLMQ